MWLRRLRAAVELPDGDAELPRLVSEVGGDARTGEGDDADWQHIEHPVVALEGCRLGVPGPIGLEGDLRHLAIVGPAGGDALGALGRAAMQQHHVRVLGVDAVELVPDRAVIVEVEPTGEGDLRPGGQHHLVFRPAFGSQEIAAVDHC